MKHKILYLLIICMFLFSSCLKNDLDFNNDGRTKDNAENVLGITIDKNQDWCTTANSSINIFANTTTDKIIKVQILVANKEDSTYSFKILNEGNITNGENITLTFDVPIKHTSLLAAFVNEKGGYFYKEFKLGDTEVYYNEVKNRTRALSEDYQLPNISPVINGTVVTFANIRKWLPGEVFYTYDYQKINGTDYNSTFKTLFNTVIFNYFPNGRKYDNLPQIKKSGYYNESVYPITTGDEPIILSPVYKNDGGYHEISEAELYYYYFKGNPTVQEIEALPKYRAIDLSKVYSNNENNIIAKDGAYVLYYFGDGTPEIGTIGSYHFPKGYKIGFVYKSNTETDQKKKQGEVYGDGRLNYNINNYGNFKSSKLEDTDPRMAWMTVNKHMFLCIESGTDKDFNDLIIEVEGGIEPIEIIPDEPEFNFYTFCYEDRQIGDYDMNDVVIKGRRVNETTVEYTLMACGASDDLYIHNINGQKINSNTEVHELFGKEKGIFINTQSNDNTPYVIDNITVNKNFSFLDASTQPYIVDVTVDNTVKLATIGQDPHAIMIPYDFKWPLERICIKYAYTQFNSWGANKIVSTDWYKYPEYDKIKN